MIFPKTPPPEAPKLAEKTGPCSLIIEALSYASRMCSVKGVSSTGKHMGQQPLAGQILG